MLNSLSKRLEKLRESRDNQSGFTLIELLIVIVILGILAAVVVFSVSGITNKGQDAACQADLTTLQTAAEAYRAQHTGYATAAADLAPKYIHSVPTEFTYTSDGTTYSVTGTGNCAGVNG